MYDRILGLIEELSAVNGTSGHEQKVRDLIASRIADKCEDIKTDALGNLIVFRRGERRAAKRIMFDAHMDEVGIIATHVDGDGFVSFETVGGISPAVLAGRRFVFENGATGVSLIKPIHLSKGDEEKKFVPADRLRLDVGADSREAALEKVRPGDTAVFDSAFRRLGVSRIKGKALDDRVGCAVLMDMILSGIPCDAYFTFSVQEEIGLRGAGCAAFTVAPDMAFVLESTTASDIPGVEGAKRVCLVGEGACVSFMDRTTVYNPELFKAVFRIAENNDIKIQTKTAVAGGNNAGSIHKSRGGVPTVALNVPCRYLHSPSCVCDMNDVLAVRRLAEKCLAEFGGA